MNIVIELLGSFLPSQDGYLFMWVLLFVAIAACVLAVERWFDIRRRTDVDAEKFTATVRGMVRSGKFDEAHALCASGGRRALPRILGAGIRRASENPRMILSAMEEETLHMLPILEKRTNLLIMFGNIATLLGLMGTIYGLILAFDAVAKPDVEAFEKTALLAQGISTAMNTTLFGLMIAVPCITVFSMLTGRVEQAIGEIDRYAVSLVNVLLPADSVMKDYKVSAKRIRGEIDTEPNIAPMMNLMVILIPLLLSSAEFVKIGAIELKLPESSGGADGGQAGEQDENARLDLGVVITADGFRLFHYFREDKNAAGEGTGKVDIPRVDGEYDFQKLAGELAIVKKLALEYIIRSRLGRVPEGATLAQLYREYTRNDYSDVQAFRDHENVKIVAEDAITYQTVVSVMDAARGISSDLGTVTMFPNVSIAGGIVR